MANLNGFDANNTPDAPSFQPLPVGKYVCAILESPMRPSRKNPSNLNLNLKWGVVEGKFQRRTFFQNITFRNTNPDAQAIGHGQLKNICIAVGKPKVNSSEELHNIPVVVTLGLELKKDENKVPIPGEYQNVVKDVKSRKAAWEEEQAAQLQQAVANAPAPPQETYTATATAAPAGQVPTGGKAPWER